MGYLQAIFTTLWTIWNHRNLVVHEGKLPNPMEVILTAQSLSCRYQDTFTKYSDTNRQSMDPIFYGVASSVANSAYGAAQEALVEAALKARNMGFHCVLFLSNRFSNFE